VVMCYPPFGYNPWHANRLFADPTSAQDCVKLSQVAWCQAVFEAMIVPPLREKVVMEPLAGRQSLAEFEKTFPDEPRCAAYLFRQRLDDFECPGGGGSRAVLLKSRAFTHECRYCGSANVNHRRNVDPSIEAAINRVVLGRLFSRYSSHIGSQHGSSKNGSVSRTRRLGC